MFNQNDPALRGGLQFNRVPVIPWPAFVACGLKVFRDGKIQMAVFDPQPMETADEAFQVLRLFVAAQSPKPGPLGWDTVPEEIKRHFKFNDEPKIVGE